MTRRILILSFYYRPDLCAGSFRSTALVEALRARYPDLEIDVITTLPNRYSTFTSEAAEHETDGATAIRRIWLPAHQSDMVNQARAYAHFARVAARAARGKRYDLVFATSSRLMTAALGAWIASRLRAPLYLDIRDIFVDTISEVLPRRAALPLAPVFSAIERWTINRATHLNVVSRGFEAYFRPRYPRQALSYFTNGIDDEFLEEFDRPKAAARDAGRPIDVVYAGNMGEGQGLHAILPALAARLAGRVNFRLIGDGGRRPQLEAALAAAGVTNVTIVPPISRAALLDEYRAADVLFLHLNAYEAFKKVLPSKIFEYAALGKPIWAGVAGHAAAFLRAEVTNAAVFEPCDVDAAVASFERLDLRDTPRPEFVARFARRAIMDEMAADIMAHARA